MVHLAEVDHGSVLCPAAGVEEVEVAVEFRGVVVAAWAPGEAEHRGGERRKDELTLEPEKVERPAALGRIEAAHRHPAFVVQQVLFGTRGDLGIGPPSLRLVLRVLEYR